MVFSRLVFRVHAIQRMYQRVISDAEVRHVIATGETVEDYPDDTPYPSRLVLGWNGRRPIHVVVADNLDHFDVLRILKTCKFPPSLNCIKRFERSPVEYGPRFHGAIERLNVLNRLRFFGERSGETTGTFGIAGTSGFLAAPCYEEPISKVKI